ncbi:MAG: hypothetical protein AVDCRST_MAG08-1422, partial [uncultured Acetobacteraceae bacterium]
ARPIALCLARPRRRALGRRHGLRLAGAAAGARGAGAASAAFAARGRAAALLPHRVARHADPAADRLGAAVFLVRRLPWRGLAHPPDARDGAGDGGRVRGAVPRAVAGLPRQAGRRRPTGRGWRCGEGAPTGECQLRARAADRGGRGLGALRRI